MTLEELEALVKQLLTEVDTLKDSVATLTNQVSKEFLQKLLDVKINDLLSPLTFGDILQYGSDGKWHNVQPSTLKINNESETGVEKLSALSDVFIVNPTEGLILMYDGVTGKWNNEDIPKHEQVNLSNYLTKIEASDIYFPILGGTIKGPVSITSTLHTTGNITSEQAITAKSR